MKYDYKTLYEKNAAFLERKPALKKALPVANILITLLFTGAYAYYIIDACFYATTEIKELTKLFFVLPFCFFLVNVLRLAIPRPRPYSEDGAGITPICKKIRSDTRSFPSRHMACATCIALHFFPALLPIGIFLMLFVALLGYTRFATGLHYPSDLVGGAIVGLLVGSLLFVL